MPEIHVVTYDDLMAADEAVIAAHCEEMIAWNKYKDYPEAQR